MHWLWFVQLSFCHNLLSFYYSRLIWTIGLVNPFFRDLKSNHNLCSKKDLKSYENPDFPKDLKSNPKFFSLEMCLNFTDFYIFKSFLRNFQNLKKVNQNFKFFLSANAIFSFQTILFVMETICRF